MIFGGDGTDIVRNTLGDTSDQGHARDSDYILGDNGNIYRLVENAGPGSTAFLTFVYDDYNTSLRLLPRGSVLLDYIADGDPSNDVGAGDVLHGEAGDDVIYGMSGNDNIYGEGQDDDIFGNEGSDWIFAGSGIDAVLGDDGIIYTSRNGMNEPLYDIRANREQTISTPGGRHVSLIDPTGELKKTVDLTPWEVGADDVIFGGLGNDFLHGGKGNDGLSGAEALEEFYSDLTNRPTLEYDPITRKINWYDATRPLVKIAGFFLNF